MPATIPVPTARKVWTLNKLYAAAKDLPEVGSLVLLVGGTLGVGFYTCYRSYFANVADSVPSIEKRHDWEKQVAYGQDAITHSFLYDISKWTHEKDGSFDVAVWPFKNRAFPREHQLPTHPVARPGVPAEGPTPVEY